MLKVLFFGQLKERVQTECLHLNQTQGDQVLTTVAALRIHLQNKGEHWHEHLALGKAIVAVNQMMSNDLTILNANDEIAFFPPVTGG